jgi:hypothetical protein
MVNLIQSLNVEPKSSTSVENANTQNDSSSSNYNELNKSPELQLLATSLIRKLLLYSQIALPCYR